MSRIEAQRRLRLLQNPSVTRVTEKHITFTQEFRTTFVRMREEGFNTVDILIRSGFRASDFEPGYFNPCVFRWRKQEKSLVQDDAKKSKKRGRPKGLKDKNFRTLDNLTPTDLKSIILVQQEMISELKKRSALTKKK